MGRMTFVLYEQRFIDLVNICDFDGIRAYFNEIELSQSFINESYHNRSDIGFSHLEVAAACSNATIVQALCEYGPFLIRKKETICGESLPHFAASVNNVGVMKVLHTNAYDIESTDYLGRTALMQACHHGHKEMTEFLIQVGCNLNFRQNETSITAIKYAMEKKNIGIVKMLIEAGADVSLWSPYMLAKVMST
jgi:ankyrin repeat protein